MKRISLVMLLALLPIVSTGCAGCRNEWKHLESDMIGLDRTITLYGATGEPIREWRTQSKVEDRGGSCYFLIDGKAIIVAGTFVIEEK